MPQSLHILNAHIIFATKGRRPWLTTNIRERVWAYQSRILQNLECNSITTGGIADHVHVLCNLTKKFATTKVLEIVKKDSSKFIKTLDSTLRDFHWQNGYGLFSLSPYISTRSRNTFLTRKDITEKKPFRKSIFGF